MQQHPATKALLDFVEVLQASGREQTRVEREDDPRQPGRTAIRITGPTRIGVQAQIDKLMKVAEGADGSANFIGPHRVGVGGWGALGEMFVTRHAEAAP